MRRTPPMSMSLTSFNSSITLSGLKSQYTRPCPCKYAKAPKIRWIYASASLTGNGPRSLRSCFSVLPPTYSMTMKPSEPWRTKL